MRLLAQGVVFASVPGSDRQSCAFPQVTVLPGGRWLCGCRAACTKGGNEGQHVLISYSDDRGASWDPAVTPWQPPALEGRAGQFRAVALTALGGERVLATLYWVDYSRPELPFFNEKTEGLLDSRIMFAESADGGVTWSAPTLMDTTPYNVPTPITGPVLLLPNGERVCQFEINKHYDDTTPWIHASVLMFSTDGGRTWPRSSVVSRHPTVFYWDQRPNVLPDGRILDLFWTYDNRAATYLHIHARESTDGGRTWSELWDTGVPGQPAPAVPLHDGQLAMVYVDRTAVPAIRCRLSRDGGRTWPAETQFSVYESALNSQTERKSGMNDAWAEMGKFSVGLPATAVLPGGEFLVVYYAGPATDRTDVRWAHFAP